MSEKEIMSAEEVLQQKMDDMKTKIKTVIMEEMPDELITNMVQSEMKKFTEDTKSYSNTIDSPLKKMVKEEIDRLIAKEVKEAVYREVKDFAFLAEEAKENLIKNYSKHFMDGFVTNMTTRMLENMAYTLSGIDNTLLNIQNNRNNFY